MKPPCYSLKNALVLVMSVGVIPVFGAVVGVWEVVRVQTPLQASPSAGHVRVNVGPMQLPMHTVLLEDTIPTIQHLYLSLDQDDTVLTMGTREGWRQTRAVSLQVRKPGLDSNSEQVTLCLGPTDAPRVPGEGGSRAQHPDINTE